MEVTINLPDKIYSNVASLAKQTHRGIDEVIAEKIEEGFSLDSEALEKQIAACSDKEILQLSKSEMPAKEDRRLSFLLQKQGEKVLTAKEQMELAELMEQNRFATLKKAFALREIVRRGLNGKN
jgi:predicted DNA-binding protein